MTKGEDTYFFIKNLQGDITKIIDENGTTAATYAYDAWGKLLSENENSAIEGLNPFRYRGYVYDEETELYYLQSRYYDPITGRFLNLDNPEFSDTGSGTPLSTNMFAYCENNPVNGKDPSGEDAYWLQAPSDAHGAGHTSVIIEDSKGRGWYFYWGDQNVQLIPISEFKNLEELNKKINKYYHYSYRNIIRFKGNFHNSLVKIKKIMSIQVTLNRKYIYFSKKNNYNVVFRNCLQVSSYILMQGDFKNNGAFYKRILNGAMLFIAPNLAYSFLRNAINKLKIYNSSKMAISWLKKHYNVL